MKKLRILAGIISLFAALDSSAVNAENAPGAVTLTLATGYYHFSPRRHTSNAAIPNVALAYDFDERWAVEADYGVINTQNNASNGVHAGLYTVDGIYHLTQRGRFVPYVLAGIGVLDLKPPVGNAAQYQANVNVGIGTQFFADKVIALRADVRDLYTLTGGKNDWMVNFGISYLFGGV